MGLKSKEQLPFKYFAVKNDGTKDFYRYLGWLNKEYSLFFTGNDSNSYYGFDGNILYRNGCRVDGDIRSFHNHPRVFETAKSFVDLIRLIEALPTDWFVKITNENRELVKRWFNKDDYVYSIGATYGVC